MSLYDYRASWEISKTDPPFYALIMAAMRKPTPSTARSCGPRSPTFTPSSRPRYNARGGMLPGDDQ